MHAIDCNLRSEVHEALRKVISKIVCEYETTGTRGRGQKHKNLTRVIIYLILGEPAAYSEDSIGTLLYSSAHSCMYRTCTGRMR